MPQSHDGCRSAQSRKCHIFFSTSVSRNIPAKVQLTSHIKAVSGLHLNVNEKSQRRYTKLATGEFSPQTGTVPCRVTLLIFPLVCKILFHISDAYNLREKFLQLLTSMTQKSSVFEVNSVHFSSSRLWKNKVGLSNCMLCVIKNTRIHIQT